MSGPAVPLLARRQERLATRTRSRSSSRHRTTSVFEERTPAPIPPGCICLRPHGVVLCKNCGWHHKEGRIRLPCPVHPRTFYLLDIDNCPKCRSFPPILSEVK